MGVLKMTVITKATTDKKDQKALLLLSDKLPEVAVTEPHDQPQTPPTRRAVVNKQNDNNPFATFLTLLVCVGIITGMSIFTYKVYRQKWYQKGLQMNIELKCTVLTPQQHGWEENLGGSTKCHKMKFLPKKTFTKIPGKMWLKV